MAADVGFATESSTGHVPHKDSLEIGDYKFSLHIVQSKGENVLLARRYLIFSPPPRWEPAPVTDLKVDPLKSLVRAYDPTKTARHPYNDIEHEKLLFEYDLI